MLLKQLSRQNEPQQKIFFQDMASWRLFGRCSEAYSTSISLLRLLHTSESTQPLIAAPVSLASSRYRTTSAQPQVRPQVVEEVQTEDEPRVQPPPLPPLVDTHKVVKDLQKAGCSLEQSEALVEVLVESQQKSLGPLTSSFATHHELEVLRLKIQNELDSVRGTQVLIEKSLVESLKSENESLKKQVQNLLNNFKEEVSKVESGLQLDLNLEKGRIREDTRSLDEKIKDNHNRIDREVAQLRTQMERQKLESIKYLVGGIFSIATIVLSVVLGLWRLLK